MKDHSKILYLFCTLTKPGIVIESVKHLSVKLPALTNFETARKPLPLTDSVIDNRVANLGLFAALI